MSRAIAGVYHSVGFSSIGGLAANTVKVQELKSQGVDHYLAIKLTANQQKNVDHFDMLAAEGFTMGARFPFSLLDGVTAEEIEPYADLDGHSALSHVYLGHEVIEQMTQQERHDTYVLLREYFPDTPIRTYYGPLKAVTRPDYRCNSIHPNGERYHDYIIAHETPKDDGSGLIVHTYIGQSESFEKFAGRWGKTLVNNFNAIRSRVEMTSPFNHQYAVHINVLDSYADVGNLAAEMTALSQVGVDWIYLRSVEAADPSEKAATTQAMIDAIGEYND